MITPLSIPVRMWLGDTLRRRLEPIVPRLRSAWFRLRPWWWTAYWHLKVIGRQHLPRSGPIILCPNHTSHLDAPAVLAALPLGLALHTRTCAAMDFWGRRPLRRLAGELLTNCLLIERKADFAAGLRDAERELGRGHPLIVFPEGRRSITGRLMDFKPGAALLSLRSGAALVPVHLDGLFGSLPRSSLLPRPADVTVRFGPPIAPDAWAAAVASRTISRRDACTQMTDHLRAAVHALSRAAPARIDVTTVAAMRPDPNILAAWLGFLAGALSGALAGLFFHHDSFFGGYSSWPRRLMRLGHIAFFGIGLLNLAYALTVHTLRFSSPPPFISLSLASATLLMPLTCYLSAAWKPFRHLFFLPVAATLAGIAGVLYYAL